MIEPLRVSNGARPSELWAAPSRVSKKGGRIPSLGVPLAAPPAPLSAAELGSQERVTAHGCGSGIIAAAQNPPTANIRTEPCPLQAAEPANCQYSDPRSYRNLHSRALCKRRNPRERREARRTAQRRLGNRGRELGEKRNSELLRPATESGKAAFLFPVSPREISPSQSRGQSAGR